MKKHFNLSGYKELLEMQESGKISLFDDTFDELLSYEVSVLNQISYNQKENYFSLLDKYISRVITPDEFRLKFLEMAKQDSRTSYLILKDFRELEVFTLAHDLKEFSDFISEISTLCFEEYEIDLEQLSETEFYNLVKNRYIQFQKAFPVLYSNNLAYENLISRFFKILTLIIVLGVLLIFFNI